MNFLKSTMGNDESKVGELLNTYGGEPWLVLRGYELSGPAARRLAIYLEENDTGGLTKLEHLDLSDNKIDPEGVDCLVQILEDPRAVIQEINLSSNPIGDDGCRILMEFLEFNTTLKTLKLNACGITDEGVAALCKGIKENLGCKLEHLDLCDNVITPVGAQALVRAAWKPNAAATLDINTGEFDKEIVGMAPLQWLTLDGNDLGDDGATIIAHGLQKNNFVQLHRLSMRSNLITNVGARKLAYMMAYCPTLSQLDLRQNEDIEENGAEAFSESLDRRDPVPAGGNPLTDDPRPLVLFEPEVYISGGDWFWEPLKKAFNPRLMIDETF